MNLDGIAKDYAFKLFGLTAEEIVGAVKQELPADLFAKVSVSENCLDGRVAVSDDATMGQRKEIIFKLFSRFSANLYSEIDEQLAYRAFRLLNQRKARLGVAESLTGGLLAAEIVKFPGASNVLTEGIVAYSNAAKQLRLDVYPEILQNFGVVSAQTAAAMVEGLLSRQYNDVAVSTTGYADSTDAFTPAGLVFVGIGVRGHVETHKYSFSGDRDTVRRCAVNAALFQLIKLLKGDFHPEDYNVNN